MTQVTDLIENKGLDLDATEMYAAILGESPSKGAKSPSLWNAAFDGLNISGFMHPMDVVPEKLEQVAAALKADKRYMGGAVTMPYKITLIPFLDRLEPEAEAIGAVNCIYRDGDDLVGTNTDGAGAIHCLKADYGEDLAGKTVLLIGTGGAGYAVAAYVAAAIGAGGSLYLANRSPEPAEKLAAKLSVQCKTKSVPFPLEAGSFGDVDIVINCSSLGFESSKRDRRGAYSHLHFTPLGPVDDSLRVPLGENVQARFLEAAREAVSANFAASASRLAGMGKAYVMDIIYQPRETLMLWLAKSLGLRTQNGVAMNLEQAVIAFDKATAAAGLREADSAPVRELMEKVW
ncbi:shikimate dehydrogenase family protein [Desulfatibacillum aliphaticivorans]|uniref:shikimate dehydrogenase family protein n=1 Tax=Desulfatibacillum aliphaticivorans TaxID=218208 RepID=UPI000428E1E5|nr:hypothetical protein [Desulfatibacillum aliphaticivorans]